MSITVGHVRAWIGTSGWNYKHWRGEIYPLGLPPKSWLEHYATRFDTVEINNSFYRIPAAGTMAEWAAQTPPHFRFTPKLWRGITHYRRLQNCGPFLADFFRVASELSPERRGPVLVQLPPQHGRDLPRLLAFLDELHAVAEGWQIAMEFRNGEWNTPEVDRTLAGRGVAICAHDMQGRGARAEPNDAPFVYIRRHGSHDARYSGSYSPDDTLRDAESIHRFTGQGREVWVYFNNDIGGHAVRNAESLREKIRPRASVASR